MRIGFYAPLKSPSHPTPSGDRTIARALMSALKELGEVTLASELRSRDGAGDASEQARLIARAEQEIEQASARQLDVWVTYHNYYKAPDLVGPAVAEAKGIPYVIVEASRARKRLEGPWAEFARRSEAACDAAETILYMTDHDRIALERDAPVGQRLLHLKPFLDRASLPDPKEPVSKRSFLSVAMLRPGDKMQSFEATAAALRKLPGDWTLTILGDGPARTEAKALFAPFGARVRFLGAAPPREVNDHLRSASHLIWPGVNEAFGMVYLEAQAVGLRVVAEDRPGVREVVGPTGALCPAGDPAAMARVIDAMPAETRETIAETQTHILLHHLRGAATATMAKALNR